MRQILQTWILRFFYICVHIIHSKNNLEYKELQNLSSKTFVDLILVTKNNVDKRADHMLLGTQVFIRVNI